MRLIESDGFPFEFLSQIAERESWRKEVHRPVYHVHKWWAKRLGSVFRGILLACIQDNDADLSEDFYKFHSTPGLTVFDPFMGSGTTVGEAHKLGMTALGRDINPVAVRAVATSFGPMQRRELIAGFEALSEDVGGKIRSLYRSLDSRGRPCDVLYHFWVMEVACPTCCNAVSLFPSYVIARNAYPDRKPKIQILCPSCGVLFVGRHGQTTTNCGACGHVFDASRGPARGAKANCPSCNSNFSIVEAVGNAGCGRPDFRHYAKLVLTSTNHKEYLPATDDDRTAFDRAREELRAAIEGGLRVPELALEEGYNTRQAMGYGFRNWQDFFNDRQLLSLGLLRQGIAQIADPATRSALLTLFSGVLEFNNLFASYKGEGTGAVRHMFSHHILKPERTPIEANVWGTAKSSGSFSNLFRSRLLRAISYRNEPTEVYGKTGMPRVCSPSFSGRVEHGWPIQGSFHPRGIYLSCGDSSQTELPDQSIDFVVTDPPFFDNVHYSELADFFYSWQKLDTQVETVAETTRSSSEVQDTDADRFATKLRGVFRECNRVLKDDGLLVFTYHHSREEGWHSVAEALLGAEFTVVNSHPVKAEMSVATPKSQAKEPIQLDIVLVCRKQAAYQIIPKASADDAVVAARDKLRRLRAAGFQLSVNDRRIVYCGQLLTSIRSTSEIEEILNRVKQELTSEPADEPAARRERRAQPLLFGET